MIQPQNQGPRILTSAFGTQSEDETQLPTISIPTLPAYEPMSKERQELTSTMTGKTNDILATRVPEGPLSSRRIYKQDATSGTVRTNVAHPYARLVAKKDSDAKRRKIWNHVLEKHIFSPYEL